MDQSEVETIIRERIEELRQLEKSANHRSLKTSYQDKGDELEALMLRIYGLSAVRHAKPATATEVHIK